MSDETDATPLSVVLVKNKVTHRGQARLSHWSVTYYKYHCEYV
jgi:hypothetical protein